MESFTIPAEKRAGEHRGLLLCRYRKEPIDIPRVLEGLARIGEWETDELNPVLLQASPPYDWRIGHGYAHQAFGWQRPGEASRAPQKDVDWAEVEHHASTRGRLRIAATSIT